MFVNQFRFFLLASLIIVCCTDLRAQRKNKALKNLGGFDERAYHFGVQLSINSANFYLDRRFDPLFEDSILSLQNVRQRAAQ